MSVPALSAPPLGTPVITTELIDEAAVAYADRPVGLSPAALADALDPVHFVTVRTLLGGPAPLEAARVAAEHRAELSESAGELAERRAALRDASQALEGAIDGLLGRFPSG